MPAPGFNYSEMRVAEQLGLSRDEARDLRVSHLERDVDWKKIRGTILLTQKGISQLVKIQKSKPPNLKLCLPADETAQPSNGAEEHPTTRRTMRVIPPMPFNPRIVYAQDDEGEKHLVEVGRNATFCFDDQIEVEPHETQIGILQCVSAIPRDRRRRR